MKKCFGRLAGIFWMSAVMGMIVCGVQTMVYAADTSVYDMDTSVYAAEMAENTTVDVADTSVYDIDIKKNTVFQVSTDVGLYEAPDTTSAVTAALPGGTPVIVKEDAANGWCKVAYREQTGYVQVSFLDIVGSPVVSAPADDQTMMPENGTVQADQVQTDQVQKDKAPTNDPQSGDPAQNDQAMQAGGVQPDNITASDSETQPDNDLTADASADTLDDEFRIIQEQNLLSYQEAQAAVEQAKSDRMWGIVIAVLVIAIFVVGIATTLGGNRRNQGSHRNGQTGVKGKRNRQ